MLRGTSQAPQAAMQAKAATHTPATLAAVRLVHLHHVQLSLALLQQRSLARSALQHLLGSGGIE